MLNTAIHRQTKCKMHKMAIHKETECKMHNMAIHRQSTCKMLNMAMHRQTKGKIHMVAIHYCKRFLILLLALCSRWQQLTIAKVFRFSNSKYAWHDIFV